MAHTPDEHEPGTAVGGLGQDAQVDGSLILANFPSELLVILAETLGNPLTLLVANAHLSKPFHAAACAALAILEDADLSEFSQTVDDSAVAAVVSMCPQLSSLDLQRCKNITDAAVIAVASSCKQLVSLDLGFCNITDAALLVALASGCKKLTALSLSGCEITDAAVVAVASKCKKLTRLHLGGCENITDAAVVAVASRCKKLEELVLAGCTNITDAVLARIPRRICVCGP